MLVDTKQILNTVRPKVDRMIDKGLDEVLQHLDSGRGLMVRDSFMRSRGLEPHAPTPKGYDAGKSLDELRDYKIDHGIMLNFGHKPVNGDLWKMKDNEVVWADTGTQVTRQQLAAMPDYQLKLFGQMHGIPYDKSDVASSRIDRALLRTESVIPDPVFKH